MCDLEREIGLRLSGRILGVHVGKPLTETAVKLVGTDSVLAVRREAHCQSG